MIFLLIFSDLKNVADCAQRSKVYSIDINGEPHCRKTLHFYITIDITIGIRIREMAILGPSGSF